MPAAWFLKNGVKRGVKGRSQTAESLENTANTDFQKDKPIIPEEPYTDADLNYNDNNSRTTIEMNDPDARPAISGSVEDMEQYDIVFIG